MRYPAGVLAALRWVVTSSWSLLVIVALLKPGKENGPDAYSFSGFLSSFFSYEMSLWDAFEAVFHIILFFVLTAVWYWLLALYNDRRKALLIAVSLAVVLGLATEIAQYFIGRSSRAFDLLANYLGMSLFLLLERQGPRTVRH